MNVKKPTKTEMSLIRRAMSSETGERYFNYVRSLLPKAYDPQAPKSSEEVARQALYNQGYMDAIEAIEGDFKETSRIEDMMATTYQDNSK